MNASPNASLNPRLQLSVRELEVLRVIAPGLTNIEAAAVLYIAPETVKFHMTNLMRKLGASNRAQLIWRGLELGLLNYPGTPPCHACGRPFS